ncbi:nose resistant to fluoxetine protein 6 [Patella vulgata]|uniref:nose resistant to fluoxetine protein 6 n=1 Tax=Patella vulgata TaxID=6465 RepID=UPI0021801B7C|nr:nose resistant to fluoxetine protein 6 [Patella vulgata]
MALYYFHRYWRLTPLYMLVILFYTHLTKYLMDGPQVATAVGIGAEQNCKDYWWTNLLYINNLYKSDSTEMCMAWSWYLANDMQFYVISPLALIPLALGYNVIGILVLLGLVASQIISTGYITWNINFAGFLQQGAFGKFFEQVYVKPYSRVGVYAIGLILGFIIHKTKGKRKIPKLILVIGSIIAAVFGLLSTYLTYDNYKVDGHKWTNEYFMAQETLYRPAWAIAVAWMIFVCVNGYGGIVNSFLSWSAWIPLSRLTYGAYLVHLIILSAETESIRSFAYIDMYYMINGFMGTFALTFAVSFILALLIEAPCLGLEKIFIKK